MTRTEDLQKSLKKLLFQNLLLESENEASQEGFLVVSPEGDVVSMNSRFSTIWGVDKELLRKLSEEKRLKLLKRKVKNADTFVTTSQKLNRSANKKYSDEIELINGRWIERYTSPLTNKNGVYYGRIWFVSDVTHRKKEIEEQKYFLGIASHELKTPLASTKAFVHLARKAIEGSKYDTALTYLEKIDQQTNHLHKLIKDFLDVSLLRSDRLELEKESFDFDEFILNLIAESKLTSKHTIIRKGISNKFIVADRYRLQEVFSNLIRNAVKYSPHATKIIITVRSDVKNIYVSIQDYGIGIPMNVQDKIFDLFFRALQKNNKQIRGFGVGLYVSAQIVKSHGGSISVESKVGKGSTFHVTLPVK